MLWVGAHAVLAEIHHDPGRPARVSADQGVCEFVPRRHDRKVVEYLIGDHVADRVEFARLELCPDAAGRAVEPEVIELERIVGGGPVERDLAARGGNIGCPFLGGIARACEDRNDQVDLVRVSPDLAARSGKRRFSMYAMECNGCT